MDGGNPGGMASDGGMRDGGQESPGESEGETRSSNGEGKQETGDRGAQNTGYWQRFGGTEVISLREARRRVRERKAKWKAERAREIAKYFPTAEKHLGEKQLLDREGMEE